MSEKFLCHNSVSVKLERPDVNVAARASRAIVGCLVSSYMALCLFSVAVMVAIGGFFQFYAKNAPSRLSRSLYGVFS